MRILDEYVKSTGVGYKETEINDSKIADNIMKSIQSEFETYKYISVKFE